MPIDDSNFSSAPIQNHIHCQNDPEFSNRYSDDTWLEEIDFSGFTFEDAIVTNDLSFITGQATTPGLLFRPINPTPIGKHGHESGYVVHKFAGEYDSISPDVFDLNCTCSTHTVGWVHDNTYNPSPYPPATISEARPSRPLLRYLPPMQPPSAMEPLRQHACNMCPDAFMHRKDLLRHKNTIHATGNEETYRYSVNMVSVVPVVQGPKLDTLLVLRVTCGSVRDSTAFSTRVLGQILDWLSCHFRAE
ncbi:hypothetical protein CIB48_g10144 [Xylaria polymorpha]|nr:hypothetical protein CIB48_g10144 [Xylaria polymorpha]